MRRLARRRSSRSDQGRFLIDGPTLLAEAVDAGVEIEGVYVEPAGMGEPAVQSAVRVGSPVYEVPAGALKKVLDVVTPQSLVAVARITTASLDEVVGSAAAGGVPLLVLVELQDPGNAGTLIRVAEASGCAGVVLTERSVDAHNPKTVRASAGSLFRVPVVQDVAFASVVAACDRLNVTTVATVASSGASLDDAPLDGALAFLIGSEAHGLTPEAVERAGHRVSIPMAGRVESLNAGVAGAVVAFEAARRRRCAN
ncbi:MAG: TrmH family RNA methyltransferase [Actinomycetes bacterium]